MVATDGSGEWAKHEFWARAGAGLFCAFRHSNNRSAPVEGYNQTAQRGEILALWAAFQSPLVRFTFSRTRNGGRICAD
eukprot:2419756-Pyramimonas_sp.AAC.1